MTTAAATYVVKLFAGLESRTRDARTTLDVPPAEAPTVAALTLRLGLAPGATGLVLVNGLHAPADRELRAGDEVSLFPPLGGG